MNPLHHLQALMEDLHLHEPDLPQGRPVGLRVWGDQWLDLRFDPETGRLNVMYLVGYPLPHARSDLMAGLLQANATLTATSSLRLGMELDSGRVALGATLDLTQGDPEQARSALSHIAQASRQMRAQLTDALLLDPDFPEHPAWA